MFGVWSDSVKLIAVSLTSVQPSVDDLHLEVPNLNTLEGEPSAMV